MENNFIENWLFYNSKLSWNLLNVNLTLLFDGGQASFLAIFGRVLVFRAS